MKLSNISIIFIIIMIPIILVLSYYISLQIDTINMQTSYTTKQLEATKEALEAFEINTVEWNEAYSENADSKRRDIMASINTFTTSFANSIGVGGTNKEYIETYIPAVACTLYDGYYIYTPSETKEVIKDESGVAIFLTERIVKADPSPIEGYEYNSADEGKLLYKCNPENEYFNGTYNGEFFTFDASNAVSTYEHILKPFSTYSARYKKGNGTNGIDITVNYTLDNYITIYGTVKGQYVVKSGYLIQPRKDLEIASEQLTEKIAWRWNESGSYTCEEYPYVYAEDNTKVYFKGNTAFQVSSTGIRTNLENTTGVKYKKVRLNSRNVVYQALNTNDIKVRNNNNEFDTVTIVQGNLYSNKSGSEVTVLNDTELQGIDLKTDYSVRNYYIESSAFTEWVQENLSSITINDMQNVAEADKSLYGNPGDKIFDVESKDPESEDSVIVRHKREIIKQTLISNLSQSITSYSRNSEGEYKLPVLTETDWDNVLRNVSIITFVQNIPIGMKYYNNYAIATSTGNKEYTNPDEIYLTTPGDEYYHRPYCNKLKTTSQIIGYRNIDYVIKSYTQDDNTSYYYKHSKSNTEEYQACYYCLVQRDLFNDEGINDSARQANESAYKIALARERYRNISEINLEDDTKYSITVIFNADGGTPDFGSKSVAHLGYYGGR